MNLRLKPFVAVVVAALGWTAACTPVQQKDTKTLKSLEDKANAIVIEKDAPIENAREKALGIYKEFDKTDSNKSLRFEAKRRLADLELEQGDQEPEELTGKAARESDQAREQKTRNAIRIYEELLANNKGQPDDKIMYQLAKAYENIGEQKKAVKLLDEIATRYPMVPYAGELHFRRAELHFLLGNYKSAEVAYIKVLELGEFSLFYEKALYKSGWTQFKLEKYEPSLNAFFHLLDRKLVDVTETTDGAEYFGDISKSNGNAPAADVGRGEKELIADTLRVINLNLTYLEGSNTIRAYFDKHGRRKYEHVLYEQLGTFLQKQERVKDAADTFISFARANPTHPRAPFFYLKTMDVYQRGGFAGPLFETKKAFVDTYNVAGTYFRKFDEPTQQKILPYLKANSDEITRHYHAQAQKTKRTEDYERAIDGYRAYLRAFPRDEKAALMNFRLAEALFEIKRYDEAIKEYENTAYQYKNFDRGAEAAYAALLAHSEREKQLQGKERDNARRLAIGSAVRFGQVYPGDKRATQVLMKITEDLFAVKKYDQATEVAKQVLEIKPQISEEQRLSAWSIIAHSSLELGNFSQAEVAYKVALSSASLQSGAREELVNGLAAAVYKQGELLRKSGDTRGAIAQFERVKTVAPESSINSTASYDIATSHLNAKNWAAAAAEFESFRTRYPNHELVPDATQNIVVSYMELKQYDRAADELTRMSEYKGDAEQKRQTLWQVATLYEKAGKTDKVVATYKKYVALYPAPLDVAAEARQKLADFYGGKGQADERQHWLREIVKADKADSEHRTDRTRTLAAQATYELAKPSFESYREVRLVEPLKVNLKKKKDRMQVALNAYKSAAEYGVADVTTAATFQIGEIYRDLGKQLMESERPGGLSPEELEQYDMLLEEQAFPFEEKAIEIHETNAKRVSDGIYDQWVRNSFDVLAKLLPVRYAKTERADPTANGVH